MIAIRAKEARNQQQDVKSAVLRRIFHERWREGLGVTRDEAMRPELGSGTLPSGLAPRQARFTFLTVCIAVALATLDTAIANVALPTIAFDLKASPADSIWVVNAYQLATVMTLLPLAALGEVVGYRVVYMIGLSIFTVASLFCAVSTSLPMLTAARALQGLGASGIVSVNVALLRLAFPPRRLGRAFGYNALVVAVAFAVGPTVAAGILSVATWPWLFAINVPAGLLALAIAFLSLPRGHEQDRRFDTPSALLNAAAFGFLILALGDAVHAASPLRLAAEFGAAIVFGTTLIRREWHKAAPLLPVDLFRRPLFALSAATSMGAFATQGLAFVSLPFYFQTTLGRSEVDTGLLMTPWPVLTAVMGPIAGRLSDRYNPAVLGGIGLAMLCVGMALLAMLPANPDVPDIVWRMAVCGMGFGFYQSPNIRAIMTSAPAHRSGGASGIVATARLTGQTVGAALVALCFGISLVHGPVLALGLGCATSGLAALVSFLRLKAK